MIAAIKFSSVRNIVLVGILILVYCPSFAQNFSVSLSGKHEQKLNSMKSGSKRFLKYHQYYKKDSTVLAKKNEKRYKHVLDSTWKAKRKEQKMRHRLSKKGLSLQEKTLPIDTFDSEIKHWNRILKDSMSSDSAKQAAGRKIQTLAIDRAKRYPGFQRMMDQYSIHGDTSQWKDMVAQVPGLDSVSLIFNSSSRDFFAKAEEHSLNQFNKMGNGKMPADFAEAERLKQMPDQFKKQFGYTTDKDQIKKEAQEKSVQQALDYFAEHAERLETAQGSMTKFIAKYREFKGVGNKENAIKRTSMQGKTFFEHLVFGGNFNIVSTDPVCLDFSPIIGYKFTTKLYAGVGVGLRHTFADSVKNKWNVSPRNLSYRGFINYDLLKGFFLYSEWERNLISRKSGERMKRVWYDNYLIGGGKKFLVHPKLYLTTTLLYNLNDDRENPVHPRRFQVKIGFQLSELATRKKQIYYNPNR